jgi:CheY-like chemotaxis protein
LNVLANAVEAMNSGGTLTIRTGNITVDAQFRLAHPDADKSRYVWVSIADTGPGMSKEILDYVFEPFFTTKEFGAGAGLGLSLVYKVIKRHKGFVDVQSAPGQGSSFTIYFPEEIAAVEESGRLQSLPRGSETILVVDDEPHVRTVLRALLGDLGYNILLASDGLEAIELVRSKGNAINLILLDIVLPGMSGMEVFNEVHAAFPGIKVILSTGYAREETVSDLIRQGAQALIRKPYQAGTIARVVRNVLDTKEHN